ncbi:MAG: VanW family protein [bacterium]|jgi:vancomycin resistance protein VanW|nr:VanW family protein [bacterium]
MHTIATHQSPLFRNLRGEQQHLQENKVKNLSLAIRQLNTLTLRPCERLSYWKGIGNPTKKKGYLPGMTLNQGQVSEGIGGGLCQLSNLIFWITIHTPLTITERWRHSYDVFPDSNRTQPFGSGATCSYPNIDLEILNTTKETFQLQLALTDTHLIGQWTSTKPLNHQYKIIEHGHKIISEPWGGYTRHNTLIQQQWDLEENKLINEKEIVNNHAIMMYEPLLSSKKSKQKDTR